MDELPQSTLTLDNVKRHVALLQKRFTINQKDRMDYPDEPLKWIKSEVDLDEQIKTFRDLPAQTELYDEFYNSGGLEAFVDLLGHLNIDIIIASLNVLAELIDPEVILNLENAEAFVAEIDRLNISHLVISSLLKINEENGELDYDGAKSCLELIENLLELSPSLGEDFVKNEEFVNWLLERMKSSKTIEYDSNRIHACEILSILLQESRACCEKLGNEDKMNSLLHTISKFRKQNPSGVEEEELVENVFQCLCHLMFIPENQICFGRLQGVKFAIRLVKERRSTYQMATKLLDYALMDCPANCAIFVDAMGLKSIFGVFMRKNVHTKSNSEQEKQEDEHVVSIIHSLASHCTGNHIARILNKFVEHRHEKLERLLELYTKYTKMTMSKKSKTPKLSSMYNVLQVNNNDQTYLNMYEAGLSLCQMIALVMVRLYNMGNETLGTCMLVLAHNKGVDMQHVYDHISAYMQHLSQDAEDIKTNIQAQLEHFLRGAYESQLFK
ncbi:bifunctional Beta-catenin-like protein 1/Armadillo-like helical/Armadillo-type fold/Beta-catenin-like protein 1 [Babesia duncani]|uniref:Bifunctional Beta-catenin-like protein 1/Armadillo-like helical/Armadillo-type fold/Beta-catenin-like protein 1 n=1 Tax=Babesia duncani TaxID=323732 RepID=A0AAD9PKQ8_9APIC|nr:bifunctional Beta-catenin-like protein 1/Armadillo-like helical/Armadillo-type fold/Beta-catenin-like protein 1 [Babesia duncani]